MSGTPDRRVNRTSLSRVQWQWVNCGTGGVNLTDEMAMPAGQVVQTESTSQRTYFQVSPAIAEVNNSPSLPSPYM